MRTETATDSSRAIAPAEVVSRKPRALGRILRVALFVLYLLIVLEGLARFMVWPDRTFQLLRSWPYDDSSNRLAWMRRHRGPQKFYQSFFAYDPLRGWALTPDLSNMRVFEGAVLNTNSRGMRGKTEYAESRSPGKKRIVILGSSYTFGDEVSDDQTYAHYLEALLPNTEVLNLGVGGYGHDQMLLYFKEEGMKYHPDILLLGFGWRDKWWNLVGFSDYRKPRFELQNHRLVLTHVPIPRPEEILRQEIYRPKLLDLGTVLWHMLSFRLGLEQKEADRVTLAILDEMVASCHQIGVTPVFAYLPVLSDLLDNSETLSPNEQFLSAFCESKHVLCAFLRQDFLAARKGGVDLYTRTHWRPYEHLIAARALKTFLLEKGLVQMSPGDTETIPLPVVPPRQTPLNH